MNEATGHLPLGRALAGLVEDEQDRRVHPLVLITGGADQRVRHSGFSMPSVSFSCRWKNRAYLSNFLAIRTAS
ncbi:hypothetical protein [Streptomyces tricolor]